MLDHRVGCAVSRRRLLLVAIALGFVGCATNPQPAAPTAPGGAPDTSAILRLVGRDGLAHACAISPTLALTNVHVVDAHPDEREYTPVPLMWGLPSGEVGVVVPALDNDRFRDLARVTPHRGTFPRYYSIAADPPAAGDRVWFIGYDFRNRRDALAERRFEAKVLRTVAGTLVLHPAGTHGSSGSCVLDAAGRVVGVTYAGLSIAMDDAVGLVVGVYGDLLRLGREDDEDR